MNLGVLYDTAAQLASAIVMQEESLSGIKIFSFKKFLELGRENTVQAASVKTEDICTIMFTSGTTGNPKVSCHKHFGYFLHTSMTHRWGSAWS